MDAHNSRSVEKIPTNATGLVRDQLVRINLFGINSLGQRVRLEFHLVCTCTFTIDKHINQCKKTKTKKQQHYIVGTRSISIQESKGNAVENNQVVSHPTQLWALLGGRCFNSWSSSATAFFSRKQRCDIALLAENYWSHLMQYDTIGSCWKDSNFIFWRTTKPYWAPWSPCKRNTLRGKPDKWTISFNTHRTSDTLMEMPYCVELILFYWKFPSISTLFPGSNKRMSTANAFYGR